MKPCLWGVLVMSVLLGLPTEAMTGRVTRRVFREAAPVVAKEASEEVAERGTLHMATRAAALIPAADLPRLTRYADAADTPATRELLMQAYAREGPGLFERIPPRLVLASGLTTAMILGTHRATEASYQVGQRIQDLPDEDVTEIVSQTMRSTLQLIAAGLGLIGLFLLWRFGLLKRHRANPQEAPKDIDP
jgi:hypothetical protein